MLSGAPDGDLGKSAPYCPMPKTGWCPVVTKGCLGGPAVIEASLQLVEEGGGMGKSREGPSKRFGGEGRKEGVVGEVVHLRCFFTCENFFFLNVP